MKSIPEFLKYLSSHCLKKNYSIRGNFSSSNVYSFYVYKKGKKIKFTHKFDDTCLEDCQTIIFETDNLFITSLALSKQLLPLIDNEYLSREGLKLKKLLT